MEEELKRRLAILNGKRVPVMTQQALRGGMQNRLARQESIRYGRDIEKQKKNCKAKLALIEQAKVSEPISLFSASSAIQNEIELEDFKEPAFKKIRNRRGFF